LKSTPRQQKSNLLTQTEISQSRLCQQFAVEGVFALDRSMMPGKLKPRQTHGSTYWIWPTWHGLKLGSGLAALRILEVEKMQHSDATGPCGGDTTKVGWRLKLPTTPLLLDDARLLEYRHSRELPMLILSLVVFVILLAGLAILKHNRILLGVAGVWIAMIVTSLQAVTYYMLSGAEVTPTQFPAIFQIFEELCQRFQAPPTRVFVIRRFTNEAEVLGFRAPYTIVLPSALLDSLEPDQLRCVLGRALGQIRFGHTRIAILLGGDASALPVLFAWIARARNLVFAGYRRAQVLSADRAGILASGIAVSIGLRIKLSVGNFQVREVRADDLIDQAYELTCGLNRFHTWLIMLKSTTPPLIYRLAEMIKWAGRPHLNPATNTQRAADTSQASVAP
jgi:Zn-dependent protease with chaperone function